MSRTTGQSAIRTGLVVGLTAVVLVLTGLAVNSGDTRQADAARAARDRTPDEAATQAEKGPSSARCLEALKEVEGAGLELRDDVEFRCPGSTGVSPWHEQHWGATCWQTRLCPGGAYVAVSPAEIGPDDARLRYVIAHEICHVNSYVATGDRGTEAAADECAARAGFPRR